LTGDRCLKLTTTVRWCGWCVPTPTQRAIPSGSISEYQRMRKLGSKRAYHAMH